MKFTVNDKTYFVKWEYIKNSVTVCKIYDNATSFEEPLVGSCAYLSEGDRFCKNTGRKISLDRALNQLFPNLPDTFCGRNKNNLKSEYVQHVNKSAHREAKAIAWTEYFKESPKRLK